MPPFVSWVNEDRQLRQLPQLQLPPARVARALHDIQGNVVGIPIQVITEDPWLLVILGAGDVRLGTCAAESADLGESPLAGFLQRPGSCIDDIVEPLTRIFIVHQTYYVDNRGYSVHNF